MRPGAWTNDGRCLSCGASLVGCHYSRKRCEGCTAVDYQKRHRDELRAVYLRKRLGVPNPTAEQLENKRKELLELRNNRVCKDCGVSLRGSHYRAIQCSECKTVKPQKRIKRKVAGASKRLTLKRLLPHLEVPSTCAEVAARLNEPSHALAAALRRCVTKGLLEREAFKVGKRTRYRYMRRRTPLIIFPNSRRRYTDLVPTIVLCQDCHQPINEYNGCKHSRRRCSRCYNDYTYRLKKSKQPGKGSKSARDIKGEHDRRYTELQSIFLSDAVIKRDIRRALPSGEIPTELIQFKRTVRQLKRKVKEST